MQYEGFSNKLPDIEEQYEEWGLKKRWWWLWRNFYVAAIDDILKALHENPGLEEKIPQISCHNNEWNDFLLAHEN